MNASALWIEIVRKIIKLSLRRIGIAFDGFEESKHPRDKDGKFTEKGAGGKNAKGEIASFNPAKDVESAVKYAKDNLGFQNVDYEYYDYGSKSYKTLNLDSINHINGTISKIQERYPELKGKVKEIKCDDGNFVAAIEAHSNGDMDFVVNATEYQKGLEYIKRRYKNDVENGYHPRGTTDEALIWHEFGHAYALAAAKNIFGNDYVNAIRNAAMENKWLVDASEILYNNPKRRFEAEMLGLEHSRKKILDDYAKKISKYATVSRHEMFAEAFAMYNNSSVSSDWADALMKAAGAERGKTR